MTTVWEALSHPGPPRSLDRSRRRDQNGGVTTPRDPGGSDAFPVEVQRARSDPNRTIGRYVLIGEIGRGGMGVVHRAFDTALRRHVAIKMIIGDGIMGADERQRRRFEREAVASAKLRHPGIVSIHEVGAHRGNPFLVMDLVDGESLETLLRREALSPRRIAEIVHAVALALEHAHAHGVVHRDVKPENVLVDREGQPHVVDFGLARELSSDDRLTMSGQIVGTPAYLAPEQTSGGSRAVGPSADVYALGGVLYRALAGRPVFEAAELMSLMRMVLFDDPEPLRRHRPGVHPDLETLTLKCLEKEPARRYPSAGALAADLRRFLDGEVIEARPAGRVARARRWARRHRGRAALLLALVGLVVLASAGGAAFLYEMRRRVAVERIAFTDGARARSTAAWEAFSGARQATRPEGETPAQARRRLGGLLALGRDAAQEAMTVHTLDLEDETARTHALEATLAYADVAAAAEQWSVAESVLGQAGRLDADGAAVGAARTRLARERARVAEERRVVVEAVLASARRGAVAEGIAYDDALFTLVRLPDGQTVDLLVDALDEVSERLRDVVVAHYRDAGTPSRDEALAGLEAIDGLERALERWRSLTPTGELGDVDARAVRAAEERIEAREWRQRSFTARRFTPDARALLGAAQTREGGQSNLLLARLCCEALGRIGIRDGAVEALGRYLRSEQDERRALAAGIALCQLGGRRAEEIVFAARTRFGVDGTFASRITRFLVALGGVEPVASETAPAYAERARSRAAKGDLDGALTDYDRALELDPEHAGAWRGRGILRSRRGEREAAIADLEQATRIAPGPSALRDLGDVLRDGGRLDAAIAAYGRAIDADELLGAAWAGRGEARRRAGDLDGALRDLTRAVDLAPAVAATWVARGRVLRERGDGEAAIADLNRAIEVDPGHAPAWHARGLARFDADDIEGAIADQSQAIELDASAAAHWRERGRARAAAHDPDRAVVDLGRALELDPEDAIAWIARGRARQDLGDIEGSYADLTRAVELAPESARAWSARGQSKLRLDDRDGAIEDCTRSVQLDPEHWQGFSNRGTARKSDDLEGALADYTRAIELRPDEASLYANRAGAYFSSFKDAESLADYTRAIELDPLLSVAWNGRGRLRYHQNDFAGAISDCSRAIAIDPRYATAFRNRGMARLQQTDLAGSLSDLSNALGLAPLDVEAWLYRGTVNQLLGDPDAALADLGRAIELDPKNVMALGYRARSHNAARRWTTALPDAEAALAIDPDDPEALFQRAIARENTGDIEGAFADMRRFLELAPNDPRVAIIRKVFAAHGRRP